MKKLILSIETGSREPLRPAKGLPLLMVTYYDKNHYTLA